MGNVLAFCKNLKSKSRRTNQDLLHENSEFEDPLIAVNKVDILGILRQTKPTSRYYMQGINSTPLTGRIAQLESEMILDRATRSIMIESPLHACQINKMKVERIEYNRQITEM